MKLTLDKAALQPVAKAANAVVRKGGIPILQMLKLSTAGQGLRVEATDSEIFFGDIARAQVEEAGAVAVESELFARAVAGAPDGAQLRLTLSDHRLRISAGRQRFGVATLPAEDYPAIPSATDHQFEVDAAAWLDATTRAAPSICTEETRYYLNGVYVTPAPGHRDRLELVATDGHRIVAEQVALAEEIEWPESRHIILPRPLISLLPRLFDKDGTILISLSESLATFGQGTREISSKLIEGTYPDYTRVIPELSKRGATLSREDLAKAADRVAPFASPDKTKSRCVSIRIGQGEITLAAASSVGSVAAETLPAEVHGDAQDIGINGQYLHDACAACDSEQVTLDVASPEQQIRFVDHSDDTRRVVVMPMRTTFPDLSEIET